MNGSAILLTGATGTVGCHLLGALLERGERDVVCLVRAKDEEAARGRIGQALATAGVSRPGLEDRVRAIAADLALPRFGLSEAAHAALASGVHQVVHCAAWLGDRQTFSPDALANVAGTNAIVSLCLQANVRLDYVSTIGVLRWTGEDDDGCLREEPFSEHPEPPVNGGPYAYYFSKWMAEQLAMYASARIPVNVHRVGDVYSVAGDAPISALVGALNMLRALPDDDTLAWAPHSISDVDAGKAIAALALAPADGLRVMHDLAFVEGVTVADVRKAFAERGVTLASIPKDEWMKRLRSDIPWLGMLQDWQVEYLLEPKSPTPRYVNDTFRAALDRVKVTLPTASDRLRPFVANVG